MQYTQHNTEQLGIHTTFFLHISICFSIDQVFSPNHVFGSLYPSFFLQLRFRWGLRHLFSVLSTYMITVCVPESVRSELSIRAEQRFRNEKSRNPGPEAMKSCQKRRIQGGQKNWHDSALGPRQGLMAAAYSRPALNRAFVVLGGGARAKVSGYHFLHFSPLSLSYSPLFSTFLHFSPLLSIVFSTFLHFYPLFFPLFSTFPPLSNSTGTNLKDVGDAGNV
jgi:hypothetical protein